MYSDLGLYIDGKWLSGEGRKGEDVINPATGKTLAHLPHVLTEETAALLRKEAPKVPVTITPVDAESATLDVAGVVYRPFPRGGFDLAHRLRDMIKRVALARALALDPEILFLDEPTSGLDPISAGDFDQLILTLQRTSAMAVFMVTHDLDSLHTICDRIAVLGEGKILEAGTMDTMLKSQHPWLKAYFHGARARVLHAVAKN